MMENDAFISREIPGFSNVTTYMYWVKIGRMKNRTVFIFFNVSCGCYRVAILQE